MEGAGASIVGHVAERATHEIDYEDLIQRMEGKGEPLTRLPNLDYTVCPVFFPEGASLSRKIGWQSQVRPRLLEAIGNCNTFEYLDVQAICGDNISKLTPSEWELVFRRFRSSTILREISIVGLGWSSDTEVESWCLQMGRILSTSSVTLLKIGGCRLSARCLQNLASGLRGNSDSKLKYLELGYRWGMDLSAVKSVADMIHSAPRLETLSLDLRDPRGNGPDRILKYTDEDTDAFLKFLDEEIDGVLKYMDEDTDGNLKYKDKEALGIIKYMNEENLGILSQALIHSSSLKELKLSFSVTSNWGPYLLLKALAGDDGNRSIERLDLQDMWGSDTPGDCIREILTSNPSLKEVRVNHLEMSPEKWHQLGKVIPDSAIEIVRVSFYTFKIDWKSIEALVRAASSDVKDPKLELQLVVSDRSMEYHDGWMLSLNLLGRVLRGEIKSLKSFSIEDGPRNSGVNQDRIKSILSKNGKPSDGEASVLKRLKLYIGNKYNLKGVWKDLLQCLRGNTSLTHLDLSKSKLYKEAFRDLMGLLQVNLTLEEIDVSGTSWEKDGKAAQIQEALKQNRKRAVYMYVCREAKLTFGAAKAGRLFLCGSPRAGKTQLRQTLKSVIQGRSWLASKWIKFRTKGIEVEFLRNDEKMQISVWDLAGQWIFRILQNVLFPETNNFNVFLFVYSPFCKETSLKKPDSCFRTELEEWLSFITSSSKVTGRNLPQVIVVISHKDKTKYPSLTWARSIVEELTKRFANFVDLRQEFFHVDARDNKQVFPLKSHVFEIFEKLLSDKSPQVPHLCFELTSLLVKNTKKNRIRPLWPSKEFHAFCAPSLTRHIPSSSFHSINHSRIMDSIISYLNDIGSIIYIPNLDFIIVDPNWLTNTFLGELIALGQHFQADDYESADSRMSSVSYTSKDGFVSESVFAGLIDEFLKNHPHRQGGVDEKVLEDILIKLDLCFKMENPSQYFIPSFIPEHASTEEQKPQELAWETRDETSQFIGIRIQCQDRRTMSLTAAFFPCFQMFMRRKFISELHEPEKNVICNRHYLQLFVDGYEIYVEEGTSHNCVDVMMLRSDRKSRSEALQYVIKHIVEELKSFCASPKGCPGVTLVLSVIQTHCVKMLIPSHLRGVVLIEDLKSNFIRSIKDKLEYILPDRLHLVKEEELFNYEHSWPSIKGHTPVKSERAKDLLPESDVEAVMNESGVEAVVNEIRQKCDQQLESFRQSFIIVSNDLDQHYTESENRVGNSSYSGQPDRFNFVKVDERLRSVEKKLGQILTFHQELQPRWMDFMSKVDRQIEYTQSLQQARTPKRPYVTNDVGVLYRLSAFLHAGKTVRLHLMCESVTGFHKVQDQEGLKIRLDRWNCAWIQKTIEISYKIIYYAVKAGLDKTLTLAQVVPDWEDLKSDIVKLEGISDSDRRAVQKGGESMELKEAWLRIQQILAPQLRDSYSAIFKLYQVKYVSLDLGGHAWVCEECMHKGLSSGILTV